MIADFLLLFSLALREKENPYAMRFMNEHLIILCISHIYVESKHEISKHNRSNDLEPPTPQKLMNIQLV
jgi:hypothetical protein